MNKKFSKIFYHKKTFLCFKYIMNSNDYHTRTQILQQMIFGKCIQLMYHIKIILD